MKEKKQPLNIDVSIFEKNGKSEFAQLIKKNSLKTSKALNDFFVGVKNEAIDTKEASRIIYKFILEQNITKEEERHLKIQVYDLFKILGIGVPFMLIPGATLLIPFILKVAEKKGMNLYPSNFKGKKNKNI
ncbi:LETM1 domain-containing protein [Lutibacter sp.]|uniref:LETM1 domain-containing protein n=1 Tax=Lutibacter sp. TaxID=1925666 RepID=UPI0025B7AF0C|nr:LETM1 domain-containing protein [Lutibacter sp.]MCF6169159.1 LETM1 domain-containing protein [Lutibacter sp.]